MFGRMSGARILGALFVLLATVLVSYAPSPAQSPTVASRHRHDPAIIRERHGRNATSTNWSGYAVTGTNGSVSDVKGSWIVPTVLCAPNAPDSYASFWVGIDGFNSNTVEQIGIDADCVSGKAAYSAWFEFYPNWPSTINTVVVSPGDTIYAEVSYSAKGQFTVTLTNVSQDPQHPFSISAKLPQAKLSSAEWIVEAPSSSGVLPLANFGTAGFGQHYTPLQRGTCTATVNGSPGLIGSFNPNDVQIDMVTSSCSTKALTSGLSHDGSSFTVAYVTPGP
jgi:hypothetical protein